MTCTCVLDVVINYYYKNNTKVYAILLDASNECDRVPYLKLFYNYLLIRFLINHVNHVIMYIS